MRADDRFSPGLSMSTQGALSWLRGANSWRYRRTAQAASPARGDHALDGQFTDLCMERLTGADLSSMAPGAGGKTPEGLQAQGQSCLIADSPFRLLQLAAKGKITQFEKLYVSDPSRRLVKDSKGRGAAHLAAQNGHVAVLDFLAGHEEDLNARDEDGNTPLHLAVDAEKHDVIDFLLTRGADDTVANNNGSAPLHVAAEKNKAETVEVMLRHDSVNKDLPGLHGATPLHYTAYFNCADSAKVLLKYKAKMCIKCDVGHYPIHIAAQSGSEEVLDLLLECSEKLGYSKCVILQFSTQEKNTPLHVAINAGSLKIVRICLKAGAPIDVEQEDGGNAVHLAAGQGNVEMLKLMFEYQPERREQCIAAVNANKETPLHRAALFNKADVIHFLVQQGAELDPVNKQGLTPLLMAADKAAWAAVQALVQHRTNLTVHDPKGRNLLHLVIMNGGKPQEFCFRSCVEKMKNMLNEKDSMGCTPLHYASSLGHMATLEDLVNLGAQLSARNNNKQAPLHFAARYGRYNTCKRILAMTAGPNTVNETDENGQTPLHQAACNGHTRVVQLLLQMGAGLYRDLAGNTPLHLAAQNGYTHSMKAILDLHGNLLDSQNKKMETPLHLAALEGQVGAVTMLMTIGASFNYDECKQSFLDIAIQNERKEVAVAVVSHHRWKEAFSMKSSKHGCPFAALIKLMPDVCMMMLDRCQTSSGGDKKSPDYQLIYDFNYLQFPMELVRKMRENGEPHQPLAALNLMVKFNRLECLSHPVSLQYLAMKWRGYGSWFHASNLLIYLIFLASLTPFIATYDFGSYMEKTGLPKTAETLNSSMNVTLSNTSEMMPGQYVLVYIILAFCILNILKEILQMVQQRWVYFTDLTNVLEWILYITCLVFIAPFVGRMHTSQQWECGALAVFLAWFNLLLFLQRFDIFGIYVVMFLEILKTLVQVLIVFSILIIAFGLSFYILLQSGDHAPGYKTSGMSLMTTSVMMLGNIDYMENWVHPFFEGTLNFSNLNFVMLIVFILLMPILLINLLIGLAVGDIEAVQKDARMKRIAMQVQLHTDLEKKLPQRLIEYVDKTTHKEYPNKCSYSSGRLLDTFTRSKIEVESQAEEGINVDTDAENQSYLYQQLHKQKLRMKQMSNDMQKQHDLLRLIVQKMEIHTEADDVDEEQSPYVGTKAAIGWSSSTLKSTLKQSHVVAKWKKWDEA